MCFSPGASFGAGALLAVAGAASVKQARQPSQLPFSAIPLLFCAQQIAEGFVWLDLQGKLQPPWGTAAIHTFLFFAQVIWPIWVPLSIWLLEPVTARKKLLLATLLLGIFTSLGLGYLLLTFSVEAHVMDHHILYEREFSGTSPQVSVLYMISTGIPCLLSSYRSIRWLGLALIASILVSYAFSQKEFISVWCFFAALLSAMIIFIIKRLPKRDTNH